MSQSTLLPDVLTLEEADTRDTRSILLQQAGTFAADETLTALRDEIYAARQSPESEQADS